MTQPLSVLIVEDMESDAQLIVRVLTKAGYTLTFEQVETAAQMRQALKKQPWEMVISDFSMPELDGHAALKLLQETGLDIPFIVVSGSMGEETAVAMMKAGAHDYLMKGKLARLVPAVERELKQAKERRERKQTKEALRASEQQHRILLQTAMDGFWQVDMQGRLLEVNETYCRMSGYNEQELLSMRIPDLESTETTNATAAHIQKIIVQGEDRFETRHRRKDGSVLDVEISVQYRPDNGGQFVAFLQDITERKQGEEKLRESNELLSLFIKHSPIYAFIKAVTPSESRNLNFSDNFQDMFGIPAAEIAGKAMDELFPPDLAAKMTADDWAVVSNGVVMRVDEDFNGRNYTSIKFPVVQGNKTLLAGYTIDITESKTSVEKLQRTIEGTINTIALIVEARDPYTAGHQKRVAEISVAIAEELGQPEEQIKGLYFSSLIHDLGKIYVPSEILSKPGKLTEIEFSLIKEHSRVGYDLLKNIDFPWPIAEIIYQHHERVNGSGYPRKLQGDSILIQAKIIGLADVIEAMSSHRPYRPALGLDAAVGEIKKNKGILYDPDLVETFLKVLKKDNTLIHSLL